MRALGGLKKCNVNAKVLTAVWNTEFLAVDLDFIIAERDSHIRREMGVLCWYAFLIIETIPRNSAQITAIKHLKKKKK